MIYVKIHKGSSEVIAICDEKLIGKKFSDGKFCLDIKENFYKGELMKEEQVKDILRNVTNLNIVGEEAIKLALEEGIIDKEGIMKIKGVPHAQLIVL